MSLRTHAHLDAVKGRGKHGGEPSAKAAREQVRDRRVLLDEIGGDLLTMANGEMAPCHPVRRRVGGVVLQLTCSNARLAAS